MEQSPLNYAIIGCGRIAPRHAQSLKALQESHNVQLVAACDVIESRVVNFTNRYGGTAYTDYRALLDRKDIDVVSVCIPSGLHSAIGQEAARAGKHVLMEKPIALNMKDAADLIETCEKERVTLGVVLQNRFNPPCKICAGSSIPGFWGNCCLGMPLYAGTVPRNTTRMNGTGPGRWMAARS